VDNAIEDLVDHRVTQNEGNSAEAEDTEKIVGSLDSSVNAGRKISSRRTREDDDISLIDDTENEVRQRWSAVAITLVATSADSVPSSNIVRITIAPIGTTSEIFNEGGIKIISLSNIRPITLYFHSSQCRLIPYLHQRPIFFKANSIRSSIVAILELFGIPLTDNTATFVKDLVFQRYMSWSFLHSVK
jgi:hypothetical protein